MIGPLIALAASGGAMSEEVAFRQASALLYVRYQDCLGQKAAVADTFGDHKAAPRNVAAAAEPECAAEWNDFKTILLSGVFPPSSADLQSLDRFRSRALDAASAEVVASRIGSCGSIPGPYQCRGSPLHK